MRSVLRRPKLSSRSQLYQPPRSTPNCTSHGHTRAGGASIVTAIVALRVPPGTSSAPGNGRRTSSSVAPQRSSRGLDVPGVDVEELVAAAATTDRPSLCAQATVVAQRTRSDALHAARAQLLGELASDLAKGAGPFQGSPQSISR
jgi:hypothetical protein